MKPTNENDKVKALTEILRSKPPEATTVRDRIRDRIENLLYAVELELIEIVCDARLAGMSENDVKDLLWDLEGTVETCYELDPEDLK